MSLRLEDIDLGGLGAFGADKGAFRVDRYHLEEPWPYIYASPEVLLRVDQHGPDYLQFAPPDGVVLFKRERFQPHSSLVVWIRMPDGRAFTNFWAPGPFAASEPVAWEAAYSPDGVRYRVEDMGLACITDLCLHPHLPAVLMSVVVRNITDSVRELSLQPAMRPHFAAFSLAPWDVPALYQRIGYSNEIVQAFDLELRSPAGVASERHYALVVTDLGPPDAVWLDYERFAGPGTFEMPAAPPGTAASDTDCSQSFDFGSYGPSNSVNGRQGVIALSRSITLRPGEEFGFSVVMADAGNRPADHGTLETLAHLLEPGQAARARTEASRVFDGFSELRRIATPDACLDRYVNEFLPLQLSWVRLLDRGWPTGMRGVRDCAQDTTALVPLDAPGCRGTLLELFAVQRSDGWFPRQYSIEPAKGRHDLRAYVDGGVWMWELLHDYLCWTKDWALMDEPVAYMDSADAQPVLQHVLRTIGYYTDPQNLGEHGLCLIREGDWNDSVNRAGLEGRGESVMVSCQVVLMLKQAAALLDYLDSQGKPHLGSGSDLKADAGRLRAASELMGQALLQHALNGEGYLNGVFTDRGEWVFSPHDPDGARRISIPVNSFGIISGVLRGERAGAALAHLKDMKQRDGWPLFHPPIGEPPISGLGRIGQGDLSPGLGENGAMYNHGCHGFLGRAAAVAGDGELLYEVLRYMLPYDQSCHPVSRSKTAPYGVVNHWKTAPGEEGRGGALFLTGSISTALRNTYDGLFGIRPSFDALMIDPALPPDWEEAAVSFSYCGADVLVRYQRRGPGNAVTRLTACGAPVGHRVPEPATGRDIAAIPDSVFQPARQVDVVCEIG